MATSPGGGTATIPSLAPNANFTHTYKTSVGVRTCFYFDDALRAIGSAPGALTLRGLVRAHARAPSPSPSFAAISTQPVAQLASNAAEVKYRATPNADELQARRCEMRTQMIELLKRQLHQSCSLCPETPRSARRRPCLRPSTG